MAKVWIQNLDFDELYLVEEEDELDYLGVPHRKKETKEEDIHLSI
jgi:hypothetical protein